MAEEKNMTTAEKLEQERLSKRVAFEVTKRFVDDQTQLLYGKGVYPLDPDVASRFYKAGRGLYLDKKMNEEITKSEDLASLEELQRMARSIPKAAEDTGDEKSAALPANFPSRKVLIENGYDSPDKLKAIKDPKELMKIKGITEAMVTKIGHAIAKLK